MLRKSDFNQLKQQLKQKHGSPSQGNVDDYVKEGDQYYNKGDYETAAAVYNLAANVAPSGHIVHEKRQDALNKSI